MPYLMQMNVRAKGWELGSKTMVFGRGEDADIRIEDDAMSRKHFAIEFANGGHKVTDLDSANGTRLNENKVKTKALEAGDIIAAGNSKFCYEIGMSTMINQSEGKRGQSIKSELQDIYKQFE